jgi:protein SCO1/2
VNNVRKLVTIAVVVAVGLSLVGCGKDKSAKQISGLQLTPPPAVGATSLPDASKGNADFAFKATEGKFLVVYFGYTQCPDVCPTTLAEVKTALKHLGSDAAKIDVGMITIDPTRDTGQLLTDYVQSFIPGSHALRTDDDTKLRVVAKAFGAGYSVTKKADGSEQVSHSGNLYVVDPKGSVVLEWPFGLKADAIATDLEILLGKA